MPRSKLCPLFSRMAEGVQHCRENCAWYIPKTIPKVPTPEETGECAILELATKILSQ